MSLKRRIYPFRADIRIIVQGSLFLRLSRIILRGTLECCFIFLVVATREILDEDRRKDNPALLGTIAHSGRVAVAGSSGSK